MEDYGARSSEADRPFPPNRQRATGYATGLAVVAMEECGTASDDTTLKRGLAWLREHQQRDGNWLAASINKKRSPSSSPSIFMNDAATAYAVLALEKAK